MKVRFFCDSGANAYSTRKEVLDTVEDLGLEEGEWEAMTPEEKDEMVEWWAEDRLEMGWNKVE